MGDFHSFASCGEQLEVRVAGPRQAGHDAALPDGDAEWFQCRTGYDTLPRLAM
jgi:hypothetical protein